jgi:2-methylisocitrate lyase-like PEP mutase family enzyme
VNPSTAISASTFINAFVELGATAIFAVAAFAKGNMAHLKAANSASAFAAIKFKKTHPTKSRRQGLSSAGFQRLVAPAPDLKRYQCTKIGKFAYDSEIFR